MAAIVTINSHKEPGEFFQTYLSSILDNDDDLPIDHPEPRTILEAWSAPDGNAWRSASDEEIRSLIDRHTWDVVDRPKNHPVVKGRWVLKYKRGSGNKITKRKARWVARGFSQRPGIDYIETYAGVVRNVISRIMLALACLYDWEVHQADIKSAYLNSELKEVVYVEMPHGYAEDGKVCRLLKGLYGLKQAASAWQKTFLNAVTEMGFQQSDADPCLYLKGNLLHGGAALTTHVDDIHVFGQSLRIVKRVKRLLASRFDLEDQGDAAFYLGIEIHRDRKAKILSLS